MARHETCFAPYTNKKTQSRHSKAAHSLKSSTATADTPSKQLTTSACCVCIALQIQLFLKKYGKLSLIEPHLHFSLLATPTFPATPILFSARVSSISPQQFTLGNSTATIWFLACSTELVYFEVHPFLKGIYVFTNTGPQLLFRNLCFSFIAW